MKFDIKKINVVGTSGSGKSTFSKRLAGITGFDHIEIDSIFWGPNWSSSPDEQFFSELRHVLDARKCWILDGNYTRTIPIKWKHVDLVIWLDYSFIRTVFRAVKRAVNRSITKEELWKGTGNTESFGKSFFSRDSIILWTIKTHGKVRRNYQRIMQDPEFSGIEFIRLRSPSAAKKFLKEFTELHKLQRRN